LNKPFHIDLVITRAGTFSYFVSSSTITAKSTEINESDLSSEAELGYFSVDPILTIPARLSVLSSPTFSLTAPTTILPISSKGGQVTKDQISLPLNGLVIETVIAKWMGTIKEWESQGHFQLMSDRGYNMLHYTPLQVRGSSNSPYSIRNQLEFDDSLFETKPVTTKSKIGKVFKKGDTSKWSIAEKEAMMKDTFKTIKTKYGMLGMIDVVLNHTANDSDWLNDHPEAGTRITFSMPESRSLALKR
jgi:glycogen debranching enzyme